jgi:hypothetical protein
MCPKFMKADESLGQPFEAYQSQFNPVLSYHSCHVAFSPVKLRSEHDTVGAGVGANVGDCVGGQGPVRVVVVFEVAV